MCQDPKRIQIAHAIGNQPNEVWLGVANIAWQLDRDRSGQSDGALCLNIGDRANDLHIFQSKRGIDRSHGRGFCPANNRNWSVHCVEFRRRFARGVNRRASLAEASTEKRGLRGILQSQNNI